MPREKIRRMFGRIKEFFRIKPREEEIGEVARWAHKKLDTHRRLEPNSLELKYNSPEEALRDGEVKELAEKVSRWRKLSNKLFVGGAGSATLGALAVALGGPFGIMAVLGSAGLISTGAGGIAGLKASKHFKKLLTKLVRRPRVEEEKERIFTVARELHEDLARKGKTVKPLHEVINDREVNRLVKEYDRWRTAGNIGVHTAGATGIILGIAALLGLTPAALPLAAILVGSAGGGLAAHAWSDRILEKVKKKIQGIDFNYRTPPFFHGL